MSAPGASSVPTVTPAWSFARELIELVNARAAELDIPPERFVSGAVLERLASIPRPEREESK